MSVQVYTFKITYDGTENKIWRIAEVSSNYDLAKLGYMVLASFETYAYHLFSIEHNGTVYETDIENYGEYPLLREVKLSALNLNIGDRMKMIYDFGCDQVFIIEYLGVSNMPKGSGRAYPKIIDGAGRSIIDDMPAFELMKIIKKTDKTGKSDYVIKTEFGNEVIWDYREYDIKYDNCLLKGSIDAIMYGYEVGDSE